MLRTHSKNDNFTLPTRETSISVDIPPEACILVFIRVGTYFAIRSNSNCFASTLLKRIRIMYLNSSLIKISSDKMNYNFSQQLRSIFLKPAKSKIRMVDLYSLLGGERQTALPTPRFEWKKKNPFRYQKSLQPFFFTAKLKFLSFTK